MNKAIVNYSDNTILLTFNGQEHKFDLTKGDVGDYWYAFNDDAKFYDINFALLDDKPSIVVYGTTKIDDIISTNTDDEYPISNITILGDVTKYINSDFDNDIDNESMILRACFNRYGDLSTLFDVIYADGIDTVICNISSDLNDEISEEEINDKIYKMLK